MSNNLNEKKKFNLPHIFVILFCIVLLCAVLTWIIPAGNFDRVVNESGREVVVAPTVVFSGFATNFFAS